MDRQDKSGLVGRPLRVGLGAAGQEETIGFDMARRLVVIADAHALVLGAAPLTWLTLDWLWERDPLTAQAAHPPDCSTMQ